MTSNPFSPENLTPTWTKATQILKGDVEGHEFHGNQYSQGQGGAPRQQDPGRWTSRSKRELDEPAKELISRGVSNATAEATDDFNHGDLDHNDMVAFHSAAQEAHEQLADEATQAGDTAGAQSHLNAAEAHEIAAATHQQVVDGRNDPEADTDTDDAMDATKEAQFASDASNQGSTRSQSSGLDTAQQLADRAEALNENDRHWYTHEQAGLHDELSNAHAAAAEQARSAGNNELADAHDTAAEAHSVAADAHRTSANSDVDYEQDPDLADEISDSATDATLYADEMSARAYGTARKASLNKSAGEIINWILLAKGDLPGHPFHGNQHTGGQGGGGKMSDALSPKIKDLGNGKFSVGGDEQWQVVYPKRGIASFYVEGERGDTPETAADFAGWANFNLKSSSDLGALVALATNNDLGPKDFEYSLDGEVAPGTMVVRAEPVSGDKIPVGTLANVIDRAMKREDDFREVADEKFLDDQAAEADEAAGADALDAYLYGR